MGIEQDFGAAAEYVRNLLTSGPHKPSDETKLRLHSLFKHVKSGPCLGDKPGLLDIEGRKKWDAWNKLGNMSKEEAMPAYVAKLKEVKTAAGN